MSASEVFPVPHGIELVVAMAALHDGATALAQLDHAKVSAGERVLVNGAAGSLGNWLIPLFSKTGATVIAAARGEQKLAHALTLGADQVVDYSEPDWTESLREPGVDVVFDAAGGEIGRAAFDITVRGGRFQAYGAASGDFAQVDAELAEERGITHVGIHQPDPHAWRRFPERALAELAAGRVHPTIGQTFPLERAADAHAAIEARTTIGKTLLITGRP